ncbi:MAG: hypothetical protein JO095_01440 [Alphaproteobacteria bacterium]|nr:hypothetical protein [Alphaproteobacteria bacterium]MBV9201387.1 hypothetical protein [Alphaproteobacteria bacterium]MBV9815364.1 hypothetical protein [Alphaproteobacteria bacterium]
MTGRPSANTRRLHLELGVFLYDRDALNDEPPYWVSVGTHRDLCSERLITHSTQPESISARSCERT